MGQRAVPEAGEEDPLAVYQLRLGESICGVPAVIGGGAGDMCLEAGRGPSGGRYTQAKTFPDQRISTTFPVLTNP